MTLKIKARSAQTVLSAELAFNFDDTMANIAGTTVDFGVTTIGAANVFEMIPLPRGARVIGGAVTRSVAFDTAAYTVIVGDEDVANRYLASGDLKAVGSSALVPTGYISTGKPLRVSIANTDVCTTGKAVVRVDYVIADRVSEIYLK